MRKFTAYFLLIIFTIYHLGYLVVQLLMPVVIHHHWERQIWGCQEALPTERLIKIPFLMPYGQDQQDFQAVNFSIEIDGAMVRVTKQRYFGEHLEVMVVPDQLQANFDEQLQFWVASMGADQGGFQGSPIQKLLLKAFLKDFTPQSSDWRLTLASVPIQAICFPPLFVSIPDENEEVILPPPQDLQLA
jgi:hypothetical protein